MLGMHRSGTSYLAECLAPFGYRLPADRGGPAPDNPRGHFEPAGIVDLHDRLLLAAGSSWARLSPVAAEDLPAETWNEAGRELGGALRRSYGRGRAILVKDPRLALLAPLWRPLLEDEGVTRRAVLALRHPFAVAASLSRRDGMEAEHALAVWCATTFAALDFARGAPLALLTFPDWARDPRPALATAAATLGLPAGRPQAALVVARQAFRPAEVHQAERSAGPASALGRLAEALFARLSRSPEQGMQPAKADLAPFRAEFDRLTLLARASEKSSAALLGAAIHGRTPSSGSSRATAARIALARAESDAECVAAGRALLAERRAKARAEAYAAAAEAQRDVAARALAERQRDAGALQRLVAATEAQRDAIAEDLRHLVEATEAQRDRLAADLARCHEGADALAAGLRATEAQRDRLDELRRAAETRAAGAEARADAIAARAETRAAEVRADAEARIAELGRDRDRLGAALREMTELYRTERMTVLKPLYRNLYRTGGRILRRHLPETVVERLKRRLPAPGGIPAPLALAPLGARPPGPAPVPDGAVPGAVPSPRGAGAFPDVFILSIIDWAFRTQRPQHLARRIAARGHRVFYLEMEREVAPTRLAPVAPGVWTVRLATTPGGPIPTYSGVPGAVQARHWLDAFNDLCERIGATPLRHVVVEHPYWWHFVRHLAPENRIAFDCMDEMSGFSNTEPHMLAAEQALIREADTVVVTSEWLARRIAPERAGAAPPVLIRNAADTAHFPAPSPAPSPAAAARRHAEGPATLPDSRMGNRRGAARAAGEPLVLQDTVSVLSGEAQIGRSRPALLPAPLASGQGGPPDVGEVASPAGRCPAAQPRDEAGFPPLPPFLTGRLGGAAIRVGYVGAIAEWFDADLVEAAANLLPEAEFHLCGAVSASPPLRLAALPNVTLHGEIAYSDVPGFLARMDVLIIPFRLDPIIRACDPVKFYEYCAAGRPTVATALPELDRAGDRVFRAADGPGFARAVRAAAAAGRDPGHVARLRAWARTNTWDDRAQAFLSALSAAPKVSAVILNWGDPALTMGAVHALLGRGADYPALEVIVADNGSRPDDLATLRGYLSRFPSARLIENGRNLGFAAGNNAGIAEASGDYVLLLNNDTFVAPGAIAAMVRHLARDPTIGVIGPLTNNIGNEARIAVEYPDMEAMIRAARRIAEGHRGQATEVAVCAYFCAMFRRADLSRFGPLPEEYGRGMFEDDDHCARIREAGYRCAIAEDAFVHHHLSAGFATLDQSERDRLFAANRAIYEARWGAWRPHSYRATRPAGTLEAA